MSQENVEIIRRLVEKFNEAPDEASAWLHYYHPDAGVRNAARVAR